MSDDDESNDFGTQIEVFIELAEVHYDEITNMCNKSTQISNSTYTTSTTTSSQQDSEFHSLSRVLHQQMQVDLLQIHDRIEEAMKGMDGIQEAVGNVGHYPKLAHETLMHCQLCRRVYATCNDSDMEMGGADDVEVNSDRVTALAALRASISQVRNVQFLEMTLEDASGGSDYDDDSD